MWNVCSVLIWVVSQAGSFLAGLSIAGVSNNLSICVEMHHQHIISEAWKLNFCCIQRANIYSFLPFCTFTFPSLTCYSTSLQKWIVSNGKKRSNRMHKICPIIKGCFFQNRPKLKCYFKRNKNKKQKEKERAKHKLEPHCSLLVHTGRERLDGTSHYGTIWKPHDVDFILAMLLCFPSSFDAL